jgi:hypothetical protein
MGSVCEAKIRTRLVGWVSSKRDQATALGIYRYILIAVPSGQLIIVCNNK